MLTCFWAEEFDASVFPPAEAWWARLPLLLRTLGVKLLDDAAPEAIFLTADSFFSTLRALIELECGSGLPLC